MDMNRENESIIYLECECAGTDHVVRVMFSEDNEFDDEADMYISVQMNHYLNFWGRLRTAFNFVFARRANVYHCHWAECLVNHESAVKLENKLHSFNKLPSRQRARSMLGPDWGGGCTGE